MTIVFNQPRDGPSTHALVIGISTYPCLLGGRSARSRRLTERMTQLTSPAISARAVADWFAASHIELTAPLATIDLLISEGDARTRYKRKDTDQPVQIDLPIKAVIVRSIRRWRDRGNQNPDNVLHFFFCGHGVGRGFETALLARDFGEDEDLPFQNNAIWLEGLKEGMKSCAATRQIYFVDACRVGSERLRDSYTEGLDPVIGAQRPFSPGMRQAIYYATTAGALAFGRPDMPSIFTDSLLKGLNGLGANDDRGDWTVETTKLQRVLTVLADEFADPQYKGLQSPTSGEQVSFDIHRLVKAPIVPLYLDAKCREDDGDDEPPSDLMLVSIDNEKQKIVSWPSPWVDNPLCAWENGLFQSFQTAGLRYSWSVKFADGREMRSAPRTLNPPYRVVEFPKDGIA